MGELSTAEVMPLMLAAVPSFVPAWKELENEWRDDGEVPSYIAASGLVRHAMRLAETGNRAELSRFFDAIEELHTRGDGSVRELATIGFLEGIQNVASHGETVEPVYFVPFLGPVSARWWTALDRFWAGEISTVRLED